MKTIFRLASFTLIMGCLISCGSKESKPQTEDIKDSTEVVVPEAEVVVEEITLSITGDDKYCFGNDPIYFHIKGGKPFDDETAPFKITVTGKRGANITFDKFTKEEDGSVKALVTFTDGDNIDGEVSVISVTDAQGTVKTMDYSVPYCS